MTDEEADALQAESDGTEIMRLRAKVGRLEACCDRHDINVAALRAENARLKAGLHDATVLAAHREPILAEVTTLRAHVAALVKLAAQEAWRADDTLPGGTKTRVIACPTPSQELRRGFRMIGDHVATFDRKEDAVWVVAVRDALRSLLDAPDLAALVREAQAKDAVVEAARAVEESEHIISGDTLHDLHKALRALDAAEEAIKK